MSGYEEFMTAIKEKGFPAAKPCDPDQFDDPEELHKILDNIMGEEIAGHFKGEDTRTWSWPKKKNERYKSERMTGLGIYAGMQSREVFRSGYALACCGVFCR